MFLQWCTQGSAKNRNKDENSTCYLRVNEKYVRMDWPPSHSEINTLKSYIRQPEPFQSTALHIYILILTAF